MYAITKAIKKWRQYLIGNHFKVYTDQLSFKTYAYLELLNSWATTLGHQASRIFLRHLIQVGSRKLGNRCPFSKEHWRWATLVGILLTCSRLVPNLQKLYQDDTKCHEFFLKCQNDTEMQKFSMWLEDLSFLRIDFILNTQNLRQQLL